MEREARTRRSFCYCVRVPNLKLNGIMAHKMLHLNKRALKNLPECASRRSIKCNKESELTTTTVSSIASSHAWNGRSSRCVNILNSYWSNKYNHRSDGNSRGTFPQTLSMIVRMKTSLKTNTLKNCVSWSEVFACKPRIFFIQFLQILWSCSIGFSWISASRAVQFTFSLFIL